MNEMMNINNITMSSREIAELTGKEHKNVMRDIRAYVGAVVQMERGLDIRSLDWDGKEGVELFEHTPVAGVTCRLETNVQNGQNYPVYYLDKSTTITIVAGYNVLLRKRIIDRWQELEAGGNKFEGLSADRQAMIELLIQTDKLEKQVALQNKRHDEHENRIKRIEVEQSAITDRTGFYTVVAYGILIGIPIPREKASLLGKMATAMSKQYNYEIGKIPDERWTTVNTYHSDILELVFKQAYPERF